MTDKILSDDELKALFSVASSLPGGGDTAIAAKEARNYDFKNPRLFINEHTRTLEAIYQDFAGAASAVLTTYFGIPAQIVVHSIKEQRYTEYFSGLAETVFLNYFQVTPSGKLGLLEWSNDLALAMVDKILGGEGKPARTRPLSAIELEIMKEPVGKILENMSFSWKRKVDRIGFEIDKAAVSPSQLPAGLSDIEGEKVFVVHCEMKLGLSIGEMKICVPQSSLKAFAAELIAPTGKGKLAFKAAHITQSNLDEVPLSVSAFMGEVPVTIGEFLKLQKGDVIPIIKINENVELKVCNAAKITARLGRVKNNKAIQVVSVTPLP